MGINDDDEIRQRLQIFDELEMQTDASGGYLTHSQLRTFTVGGIPTPLIEAQGGIRNPRDFEGTLSIVNDYNGPYENSYDENGILHYHFRSGDPDRSFNRKLRKAAELKLPLILFNKPLPNMYVPVIGVQIVDERIAEGVILVATGGDVAAAFDAGAIDKRYVVKLVKQRVHQPAFRAVVLDAYSKKCAICRLNHADLLDAAHIIPDADEGGSASVPNGLSLCKIHHAAYDRNLLGIDPDYKVHIDAALLEEIDGPMLQHGLKAMHLTEITTPSAIANKPDRDKLAQRFELFMAS